MQELILQTKLQRPPVVPDILPRDRLIKLLNEGRHRTLTLISAPAGYGKSTLASRWVAECDCPCGWLSLDQNDGDLQVFLTYFLAAVKPLIPGATFRTEVLLAAEQLPDATDIAIHLLNDLHAITAPFILVLDDYHRIRETPVHTLMEALLEHPSRAMHLVLLSRRDPALPLATLRGRGKLTEIRAADLRFTPAEAGAFLTKMLNVTVDDATAQLLDDKIEGWATGLRLAGLYLHGQDDLKQRLRELTGNSRHIAEYLATEVLSRQDPEFTACLLETSILERFCSPLCQAIHAHRSDGPGGPDGIDAKGFIQQLTDTHLFVIPLDNQGHWYRYHHLFQGFLRAQLDDTSRPEKINALHHRAGQWFAEESLTEEALAHALAAGDIPMAVQLVMERRYELMNTTQFFRLKHWIAQLPANTVEENPLLNCTRAFIGIEQGQDAELYTCTDRAQRLLARLSKESEEYDVLKAELDTIIGFIDMATGDAQKGMARTRTALNALPQNALLIRSLGILTLALCHQMTGNPELSIRIIQTALMETAWPDNIRARIYFYLSIACYLDTDLSGALKASRNCLDLVEDSSFTHTRTFAEYLIGAASYWRNELNQAETYLQRVLDEYQASNPSYVGNAAYVLASIYLARNTQEKVEPLLTRIGAFFQKNKFLTLLTMTQAFGLEVALRTGGIKRSGQHYDTIDFNVRPPLWFFYVPQLTPIKLLIADGSIACLDEARERLIDLDREMERINRKNVRIDVLALLAVVCRQSGDEATALEKLGTALSLAEPGGWVRNFVDLGAPMHDLLVRLIKVEPTHAHARRVLSAFDAEARHNTTSPPANEQPRSLSSIPGCPTLTPRELELLLMAGDGMTNGRIASTLHIALETVKTHLRNVYKKLDANGRMDAVKKARAMGIISND